MHRLPIFQTKPERTDDNDNDIDESDSVPNGEQRLCESNLHCAKEREREDGDDDIAPAGWRGERAWQLAPPTQHQKVTARKRTCAMEKHKPAEIDVHGPGPD